MRAQETLVSSSKCSPAVEVHLHVLSGATQPACPEATAFGRAWPATLDLEMLWHIEGTQLRIFGSVHVSNRPLLFSEPITRALNEADVFAFETNFDVQPNLAFTRYGAGNSLGKNIPAPLFADTKRLWMELSLEGRELEHCKPWWVAFRLMNAAMVRRGFTSVQGIDRNVLNFAKDKNKTLFFLESVSAGLEPFANAPREEHQVFLSRVAQHTEEGLEEVASLVTAWESGNPSNLMPVVERALRLMPMTYSAALAGRNRTWIRHLIRLARSGKNVVAVVGALHLVGTDSIPSLLAAAGHTCSLTHEL